MNILKFKWAGTNLHFIFQVSYRYYSRLWLLINVENIHQDIRNVKKKSSVYQIRKSVNSQIYFSRIVYDISKYYYFWQIFMVISCLGLHRLLRYIHLHQIPRSQVIPFFVNLKTRSIICTHKVNI